MSSSDLRKQIFNNMNEMETDELTAIWQTNDRVEWSEAAFDAIQAILLKRLGELPAQNTPILEHPLSGSDDVDHETLGKFAGMQNEPVFYKPKDVLRLERWLNRAAYAFIGLTIVASLLELGSLQNTIWSFFTNKPQWNLTAWLITLMVFPIAVALQIGFYFLVFKAFGSILKILMEIEFNSRSV